MSDLFKLVGRIVISNQEANEAIDETTQKAENLGTALGGAGTAADNASAQLGEGGAFNTAAVWMGNVLYKLTEKAVQLGFSISKLGFNYNADMETYKVAFTTMMDGNSEAAEKLIEDLRELGSVTPMNTAGLVANARTMMGFGIAAEDVIDTLKMLGDAAQGNQTSLNSLVLAYSQMMAAGQLYAQDAYQMTNAGFPIWKMLEEHTGIEIAALRKMGEKGEITTDMVKNAYKMATSEGGLFYQAMEKQAETFEGKMSTLQDNAEMTTGSLMQAFFDVAKSDVIPKLTESLEKFGNWCIENQESLQKMAEALGKFVTVSFDGVLAAFQWITENGNAVALAISGIATAMALAAGSAHPYAYAVTAIVSALAMMKSANADGDAFNSFFNKFSDEELQKLQAWVDAVNETRAASEALNDAWLRNEDTTALATIFTEAQNRQNALYDEANAIDGLVAAYYAWNSAQEGNAGQDFYFDVLPKVSEDGEGIVQTTLNGFELEVTADVKPNMSQVYAQDGTRITMYADVVSSGSRWTSNLPGFATGLERVPRDNFLARLHKDEAVLTSTQAAAWRSGMMGGGDVGRLEAAINNLGTMLQQISANTAGGHQVVLDSGVLVGQIAPAMDARLGTISGRKGRRA